MMQLKPNDTNPFLNLAFELLGNIFVHCLPPETVIISSASAPLLLVQVCRRWREVALATPTLWQTITLGSDGNRIGILDLFLANSGSLPLIITLPPYNDYSSIFDNYNPEMNEQNEVIINRILDNFHRILSLKGYTYFRFSLLIFKRLTMPNTPRYIHAPLLKCLDIAATEPLIDSADQIEQSIRGCIISPNLEELHLRSSVSMRSMICLSPGSLRVVRGLRIYDSDVAQRVNDVLLMTDLEILEIRFQDVGIVPNLPSVYLPSLKDLHLTVVGIQSRDLIPLFSFPNIQNLDLDLHIEASFPQVFESLMKEQTPPLRSLRLSNSGLDADTVWGYALPCFHRFKNVEQLTLEVFLLSPDKNIIQILMEKEGPDEYRLFPQLSSLTIRRLAFDSDCGSIIEVLSDRSVSRGGTLRYVELKDCRFPVPVDREALRTLEMQMKGRLEIDIIYFHETALEVKCRFNC